MMVRDAVTADLERVLVIADERRRQYETYQAQFWHPSVDAVDRQRAYFGGLLADQEVLFVVAEVDDRVRGFLIARVVASPPVYDPGGGTCLVDDFTVAEGQAWPDLGPLLLERARRWAAEHAAAQLVVVTAARDGAKRAVLSVADLSVASEWWVGSVSPATVASVPAAGDFDAWYESIIASPDRDRFVQEALDLPAEVESSGYLNGSGLVEVRQQLGLRAGETLVELGCGRAGYGLACIERSGARLVGVDVSPTALRAARMAADRLGFGDRAEFVVADLADTGLPDQCAEAVLCVDAFHFAASVPAAAAEVVRLLKPGGRLVMTTWEAADAAAARRLPQRIAQMDTARDLHAAGLHDVQVMDRAEWARTEASFWSVATRLEVGDDPALADLRQEALEFLPLADALRRVLATAHR